MPQRASPLGRVSESYLESKMTLARTIPARWLVSTEASMAVSLNLQLVSLIDTRGPRPSQIRCSLLVKQPRERPRVWSESSAIAHDPLRGVRARRIRAFDPAGVRRLLSPGWTGRSRPPGARLCPTRSQSG